MSMYMFTDKIHDKTIMSKIEYGTKLINQQKD